MADLAVADTYVPSLNAESLRANLRQARLDEAFPNVDPGERPLGQRVLVQIMIYPEKTRGGIIITDDTKDANQDNSTVAKVIALGRLAYHNRSSMEPWPEGEWIHEGAFVRVPKYGGMRFDREIPGTRKRVIFAYFDDLNFIAEVKDPLETVAYV